ncbi:hypothetical protein HYT23_02495 [Candidatus Pacearchaeota archaeon]|nr:hypothetical protein [Candidatus Pacearchaeota archaeon]
MRDLESVKIRDLTSFFIVKSSGWTSKTSMETKKRAVESNSGKFALVKTKQYLPEAYLFGRIESPNEVYFSMNQPGYVSRINYEDIQELLVENR